MRKLIGIGECIVDFLPSDKKNEFIAKAGGAPVNVCACVGKLGAQSYYLGKLSNDFFGDFLLKNIKNNNIKTEFVKFSKAPTALDFVSLDENGERKFSFYRKQTADLLLNKKEIQKNIFAKNDIFHMCSVALVKSPIKCAHKKAIALAIKNQAFVFFDVNVRLSLYKSENICRKTIVQFLKHSDVVKISDDELTFITNEKDELQGIIKLLKIAKRAKLIFLTKGKNGATVYDRDLKSVSQPARKVEVVDTTGAGDCFIGCVIYKYLTTDRELTLNSVEDILSFAIAGSSIVVTKKGAMEAMPTLEEINSILKNE